MKKNSDNCQDLSNMDLGLKSVLNILEQIKNLNFDLKKEFNSEISLIFGASFDDK